VETQEETWISQARRGDAEAFAALVEQHQRFAYNLALRVLSNEQDAEDITQEAFLRAWLALPNFRGQSRFRTWLYRIVTNLCYNRLPGLRRELSALGEAILAELPDDGSGDQATPPDPADELESRERRAFLHRQIDALPESYRLLVTLRYQQELSYEEIASVVSLPLGTVKTGLFRAKIRLRDALRAYEEEQ
jgi:RNA polymerase sigma-70 factor (ECF subfamily)